MNHRPADTLESEMERLFAQADTLPWWARWRMRRKVEALRRDIAQRRNEALRRSPYHE